MEAADALSTVAEMALGLAGFSGVVVAFGRRREAPDTLDPVRSFRLYGLLSVSFGALFLALLPFVFHFSALDQALTWRLSSASLASFVALFLGIWVPRSLHYRRLHPEIFTLWIMVPLVVGHAASVLVHTSVAFGVVASGIAGLHLASLYWLLLQGCIQFTRILFVRPQEN